VNTEPASHIPDAGNRFLATLTDNIGGAELSGQCDPVGAPAHDNDLLGAETLGCDHAAKADRAVSDYRRGFTRGDTRHHGGVMPGSHDVRQRQQRGHQGIVGADLQSEQRPASVRNPERLGLRAFHAAVAKEAAMETGGVQVLVAEHSGAVGERERHDHQVALLDRANRRPDFLDDPDSLMAHALGAITWLFQVIRPEVTAADAGARHAVDSVGWLLDL
jgi:hypothetical protein